VTKVLAELIEYQPYTQHTQRRDQSASRTDWISALHNTLSAVTKVLAELIEYQPYTQHTQRRDQSASWTDWISVLHKTLSAVTKALAELIEYQSYTQNTQRHDQSASRTDCSALIELWFYVTLDTIRSLQRYFPKPISWLRVEKKTKPNTTRACVQ